MHKLIALFCAACLAGLFGCSHGQFSTREAVPSVSIIPQPSSIVPGVGTFRIDGRTRVVVSEDNAAVLRVARMFTDGWTRASGVPLPLEQAATTEMRPSIVFRVDTTLHAALGLEGYRLRVTPESVVLLAATPNGLFYASQTLRQLLPPEAYAAAPAGDVEWKIPCVSIEDIPRFSWRGMMLDVSRHFFDKEFVKHYIDLLAMHKMNVFHWHLADDQGWRIEIKRYPRLASVGAWRVDREKDPWENRARQMVGETATYGGYYTQDDIREVVAYARDRFVTVVPEIEMPAHCVAALAAYPEFSCTGGPFTVLPGGYWPCSDIYCAGKDSTFEFLKDVLGEVCALFPSPFVHIGGDEADKTNWKKCPMCQARIKAEGLKNEGELQSYFIRRIERYLLRQGKRLIGWDEILEGGLAPQATVMSWRGIEGGIAAAKEGHDVVMSPTSNCYFDYSQAETGPESGIGSYLPLENVYAYEPIPSVLDSTERKHILGAQANLWTEYVPTVEHAEYMVLPRMSALAEVVWSNAGRRDYKDFLRRLELQYHRFDAMHVSYKDYR